jgi:hypothetical protein
MSGFWTSTSCFTERGSSAEAWRSKTFPDIP